VAIAIEYQKVIDPPPFYRPTAIRDFSGFSRYSLGVMIYEGVL